MRYVKGSVSAVNRLTATEMDEGNLRKS